jgi:N-hydroxyarylamine O-acetyltransferase
MIEPIRIRSGTFLPITCLSAHDGEQTHWSQTNKLVNRRERPQTVIGPPRSSELFFNVDTRTVVMASHEFPLAEYYNRIGVPADGELSVHRLEVLQRGQLYSIPYENFDVLLGRDIDLSVNHLVEKMVRSSRGGYCFELNGLFKAVLQAEGFDVRTLLARVHLSGEPTGRGHQISKVSIADREWIVDVGNGAYCPKQPLPFELNVETIDDGIPFRIIEHQLGYMLQAKEKDEWKDIYSFDLTPVVPADIEYGNHFTSTHPSSFFKLARIAVLWHPDGRTIIYNNTCTIQRGGNTVSHAMPDDESYLQMLREHVGIDLDIDYDDLPQLSTEKFV